MVRLEKSVEIKASPEKVWEMVALDKLPEWMDGLEMKSAKYTSEVRKPEDKYKVGARKFVHVGLTFSFYIVIGIHILHGLGFL